MRPVTLFPDFGASARKSGAPARDDTHDFENALASALSSPAAPVHAGEVRPAAQQEPADGDAGEPRALAKEIATVEADHGRAIAHASRLTATEPVPATIGEPPARETHRAMAGITTSGPVSATPHVSTLHLASHRVDPSNGEPFAPVPQAPIDAAALSAAIEPVDGAMVAARILSAQVTEPVLERPRPVAAPRTPTPTTEAKSESREMAPGPRRIGARGGAASRHAEAQSDHAGDRPVADERADPAASARSGAADARSTRADGAAAAPRATLIDAPPAVPKSGGDRVTLQFQGENGLEGRLRIAMRGQTLHATIVSDHGETVRRLEGGLNDLQRTLTERGFGDARIAIQHAASENATLSDRPPDSSRGQEERRGNGQSRSHPDSPQHPHDESRRPRDKATSKERQAPE